MRDRMKCLPTSQAVLGENPLGGSTLADEASPDYLKIKPMRKQRNMGEQGMLYSPYAIMDVFAIGEVVVGSEKNITEKYATKAGI